MPAEAHRLGCRIDGSFGMARLPDCGGCTQALQASGTTQSAGWNTSLWLDGDSGARMDLDRPRGVRALHFADVHDLLASRANAVALGLVGALLPYIGAHLWLKELCPTRYGAGRTG